MLKRLLLMAVLVVYSSYSYSEDITPYFGTTGNAAAGGNSWSMETVLPTPPGLDINTVIYDYTIQKNVNDSVKVHVQNENTNGNGYIFRETDEWQPGSLSGTEIRKVIPVIPNIPRQAWGDGSIEVEGNGSVEDARVVYSYKVDPCYDPQFDPNCPGYVTPTPPKVEVFDVSTIYDATQDEYVNLSNEEQVLIEENEEIVEKELDEDDEDEEKRKREYRLAMLADTNANLLFAESQRIEEMNRSMQVVVNNQYLNRSVPGGQYNDSIILVDTEIKDSKSGLRNGLAQQLLHEKMISMQYKN
jgi:hypothetical protein